MKNKNQPINDDWATPEDFKQKIRDEFGEYFDPCPFQNNIEKFDGLKIEWDRVNFINPPYSRKLKTQFVLKGIEQAKKWKTCVFLIPVSTSTKLFHEHILPNKKEIRFIKWRIKFSGWNAKWEFVSNKCGQHDSMLVIF